MRKKQLTMSVDEAAEALGVSRGSAYKAARAGELPVIRLGKRFLVIRDRFEELFRNTDWRDTRNTNDE
jgi:excisionase family DNA binding protein